MSQVCSRSSLHSATPQCVRWRAVLRGNCSNSGVYLCLLKGLVYVYSRCPARTVGFFAAVFTCNNNNNNNDNNNNNNTLTSKAP